MCSVTRAETDGCFTRSSARHLGAKEIIHKRRFRYTFPLKVGKRNRTNRALTREHERVFSSPGSDNDDTKVEGSSFFLEDGDDDADQSMQKQTREVR